MQVRTDIGFDFASAQRTMLRHNPDIMMVGEIRDGTSAAIAIQAALTGYLVFSTVHANSAAGAAIRLLDLGVEPFLLSAALIGAGAQRLARRVCPDCAVPDRPPAEALARIGAPSRRLREQRVFSAGAVRIGRRPDRFVDGRDSNQSRSLRAQSQHG